MAIPPSRTILWPPMIAHLPIPALPQPSSIATLRAQALCYRSVGRAHEEETLWSRILALQATDPNTPQRALLETQNALALALLAQGKEDESERIYDRILASWNEIRRENRDLLNAILHNPAFCRLRGEEMN